MKMFVVLALAAVALAEPEADPAYLAYSRPTVYSSPLLRSFPTIARSTYATGLNNVLYNPLYNTLYNPYNTVHRLAKREAEAEADPALLYTSGVAPVSTYSTGVVAPVSTYSTGVVAPVSTYSTGVVAPVSTYSNRVVAPVSAYSTGVVAPVSTYSTGAHAYTTGVHAPVSTYSTGVVAPVSAYSTGAHAYTTGVHAPVSTYSTGVVAPVSTYSTGVHAVPAPTHTVTSYKNPEHYVAVSNGAYPSYIAKNHGVAHVVKRDAEADPAVVYNANLATAYPYAAAPFMAHAAGVYSAFNPVYAAGHHAVAQTYAGLVHSSNVGICTNYLGAQVAC